MSNPAFFVISDPKAIPYANAAMNDALPPELLITPAPKSMWPMWRDPQPR